MMADRIEIAVREMAEIMIEQRSVERDFCGTIVDCEAVVVAIAYSGA